MAKRDLVVIGASAGGIEALQQLLFALPRNFGAAILVVLHSSVQHGNALPEILSRSGSLPAVHPKDCEPIEAGRIYVAVPNFHLIVEDGVMRVLQGPRENLHRPAVDPLFRSAAAQYGPRVVGVILSGNLDDGTAGLMMVSAGGGIAIAQDPATTPFSSMPRSALEHVPDARLGSPAEIGELLVQLTREELPAEALLQHAPRTAMKEARIAELDMSEVENENRIGHSSSFSCPDCGGVLWETDGGGFLRFRCRVGHAFTAQYLEAEQRHKVETALWAALRALEESASLSQRMAQRSESQRRPKLQEIHAERAANKHANARVLREFLLQVNAKEDAEKATTAESDVGDNDSGGTEAA